MAQKMTEAAKKKPDPKGARLETRDQERSADPVVAVLV